MPESIVFGAPPPGAPAIQSLASYAHYTGIVAGGLGSLLSFGRAKAKGVGAGVSAGIGLACVAGASFAGMSLYGKFIYRDIATPTAETRLVLMSAAALAVGIGVNLIPGLRPAGGGWRAYAVPGLATLGFVLAGVAQLPAVGAGAAPALGAIGGVFAVVAGVLFMMERKALPRDLQAGVAMPVTLGLVISGVLTAAGAALSRTADGQDKGTLALALAEAVFALFAVLAWLAIAGSPKDFPKPVKAAAKAAKPGAAAVIPPPPGGLTPPPAPGGPTRVPMPPRPPVAQGPARPASPMPPPPPGS